VPAIARRSQRAFYCLLVGSHNDGPTTFFVKWKLGYIWRLKMTDCCSKHRSEDRKKNLLASDPVESIGLRLRKYVCMCRWPTCLTYNNMAAFQEKLSSDDWSEIFSISWIERVRYIPEPFSASFSLAPWNQQNLFCLTLAFLYVGWAPGLTEDM
jgi:hypothetical protein